MVCCQVADVARAMELGRHAAEFVSSSFIRPVKLEFEKVCCVCVCPLCVLTAGQIGGMHGTQGIDERCSMVYVRMSSTAVWFAKALVPLLHCAHILR